jgi:hypothetical protein
MPDDHRPGRNAALIAIALSAHEPGGAIKTTLYVYLLYMEAATPGKQASA